MSDDTISVRFSDLVLLGTLLLEARSVAQYAAIERSLGTPDAALDNRAERLVSAAVHQMIETLRGAGIMT